MAYCFRASCSLCVCMCVRVHFHTSTISTYISTVWRRMGSKGPRGLWVYAKTIIKDRDCGRLCENVFMYVCMGRQQGPPLGRVLIPNGRVRTGRVKSVCT